MDTSSQQDEYNNYVRITVPLRKGLSELEKEVLEELNQSLSDKDAQILESSTGMDAYLRSLDINEFSNLVKGLVEKHKIPLENPFFDLLQTILDIRSYGIKSGKRVFAGYADERKVRNRKQKEEVRKGSLYTGNGRFSRFNNEFPEKFENRILCVDASDLLKKVPDNCVDLVLTSPPYNFGLEYENNSDGVDWNIYFSTLNRVLTECVRVTKYGGRIAVNVQPLFSDFIPIHHLISSFMLREGMTWRNEILWEKNNYNAKYTAWGSWKSPNNPYLKYTREFIEVFSKCTLKHEGNRNDSDIRDEEFKKLVNAYWSIAPEKRMREYGHPAMFPEKLAKRPEAVFIQERCSAGPIQRHRDNYKSCKGALKKVPRRRCLQLICEDGRKENGHRNRGIVSQNCNEQVSFLSCKVLAKSYTLVRTTIRPLLIELHAHSYSLLICLCLKQAVV